MAKVLEKAASQQPSPHADQPFGRGGTLGSIKDIYSGATGGGGSVGSRGPLQQAAQTAKNVAYNNSGGQYAYGYGQPGQGLSQMPVLGQMMPQMMQLVYSL